MPTRRRPARQLKRSPDRWWQNFRWRPEASAVKRLLQLFAMLLVLLICGCTQTGYRNANGVVSFITWDEAHGRREHPVTGADPGSFQVLERQGYAKDRSSAYFRWTPMDGA